MKMARDTIVPVPIPVRPGENVNESYCATYLDYSEESFTNTSKELVSYLRTEYDSTGLGGTTESFMAHGTTVSEIETSIVNAGIYGLTQRNLNRHVILMQTGEDVLISVILY